MVLRGPRCQASSQGLFAAPGMWTPNRVNPAAMLLCITPARQRPSRTCGLMVYRQSKDESILSAWSASRLTTEGLCFSAFPSCIAASRQGARSNGRKDFKGNHPYILVRGLLLGCEMTNRCQPATVLIALCSPSQLKTRTTSSTRYSATAK